MGRPECLVATRESRPEREGLRRKKGNPQRLRKLNRPKRLSAARMGVRPPMRQTKLFPP